MSGLARKFVILDATKTEPMIIVGLVVAILALGAVYWFVRESPGSHNGVLYLNAFVGGAMVQKLAS